MDNITSKLSKSYTHFRNKICITDNCKELYELAVKTNKLIEYKKEALKKSKSENLISDSDYKKEYIKILNEIKNNEDFINLYKCEIEKCNDSLINKLKIFINKTLKSNINIKNKETEENLKRLLKSLDDNKLTLSQRNKLYDILIKHVDDLIDKYD